MKLLLVTILIFSFLGAKVDNSNILSRDETIRVFTPEVKQEQGIHFPIFRVYSYSDKIGKSYLVLTENAYQQNSKESTSNKITAFCFKEEDEKLILLWDIKDFTSDEKSESGIWFWTKYFNIKDFDNDGLIDPIIIYGTSGVNQYSDGRVKIIIYYKGEKVAIRHQNDTLDCFRHTQIDNTFYYLPIQIQKHIKLVMETMIKNEHIIFPFKPEKFLKRKAISVQCNKMCIEVE